MVGIIFSMALFFLSVFFLFKQALVTAAAIMGFSLIWYVVGAHAHRFEILYSAAASDQGGNNS